MKTNRAKTAWNDTWMGRVIVAILFISVLVTPLWAQDKKEVSVEDLAKKSQNPVDPMISIPLQNNINFKYGPNNNTQNVLNIQPVIPFSLNKEWNLITRTIAPVVNQPWPEQKFGLGDVNISFFLSPANPKKRAGGDFIWGAGPILQFPTATGEYLGTGKWAAGPAAVGVYMKGPWVIGLLGNNLWSYAGETKRETVNQMLLQPFVNYNLPNGWFVVSSPILNAYWQAKKAGNVWLVPMGGGVGKVFKMGNQSFSASVQYYYNVAKPEVGPDSTLRLGISLLFPK